MKGLIVFGALFTALVCLALGRLLFERLGVEADSFEHNLLAGICGSALLSLIVFLLCTVSMARTWVFLAVGMSAVTVSWLRCPPRRFAVRVPWLFGIPFAFYTVVYLSNSLAPEFSPDGSTYHLGLVARYFTDHGFERLTTNMYGNLSQGMEMLFLFAFAFGKHSAAATVHCIFLLMLPCLMLCYGRRTGHPRAGLGAAMLVFFSPLAGIDGVSAYNDVGLATVAFGLFYLLEIGGEALLVPAGLLAGFCFAIKYTGFVAVLYAAVVLRKNLRKPALAAAAMALPWLLKNEVWLGNPVSPFLNRVFPNPYIHVSFEESYRHYFTSYGLTSFRPLFRMVTTTGELGGQIGPVFLLSPLALLALRSRAGRQCLTAALIFLIPYPQNIGARFLIPALPFVALGIALALEASQTAISVLILAAAILAWPRAIDRYRAPAGGWQISKVPWKAALGITPAEDWLGRNPEYRLARSINAHVPENKTLWSSLALAEAYIKPKVLVYYYSAESEEIEDILLTGYRTDLQPLWNWRFTFPERRVSRIRINQNATSKSDIWSIGEARFLHGDDEVAPVHADARPFPWEIGLALDRNPVTRWRSWESLRAGMHADFDFPAPAALDRVDLYCSHDQYGIDLKLDGIEAKVEKLEGKAVADLRRLATRTIRSHGVEYLVIGGAHQAARDIEADPARWGMVRIATEGDVNIYRIP